MSMSATSKGMSHSQFLNCKLAHFVDRKHYYHLATAMVLSLATGAVDPALAWVLGRLLDGFSRLEIGAATSDQFKADASFNIACLLGLGSLTLPLNAIFFATWIYFGEKMINCARMRLSRSLLGRSIPWFERLEGGAEALSSHIQNHLLYFRNSTSQSLGMVFHSSASFVIAVSLGLYVAWDLTVATLAPIPLTSICMKHLSDRMTAVLTKRNKEMDRAASVLGVALKAIDTVQCFNAQEVEVCKYKVFLKRASGQYSRYSVLCALQVALARFTTLAMFVVGFGYSILVESCEKRTPGQLLTVFWACLIATQAVERLVSLIPILQKGTISAQALSRLSCRRWDSRVKKHYSGQEPGALQGEVILENVSFTHGQNSQAKALKDVTLCFPSKKTTFVIGASGSGKTTLSKLLLRFYKPQEGIILLDNKDLNEYDPVWLRERITLVMQSPELFRASIRDNLALAVKSSRQTLPAKDIGDCLKFSELKNIVESLPQGLNTQIGQGGTSLSGGQCQRLAISQARLRDSPILILDEATSALDRRSRDRILERLREWRNEKTTIIITHDYSHIQKHDYVYCLEDGSLAREGYWEQLLDERSTMAPPELQQQQQQQGRSANGSLLHNTTTTNRPILTIDVPSGPRLSIASGMLTPFSPLVPSPVVRTPQFPPVSTFSNDTPFKTNTSTSCEIDSVQSTGPDPDGHNVLKLSEVFSTVWPNLDQVGRFKLVGGTFCAIMHALATPLFAQAFAKILPTFTFSSGETHQHTHFWISIIAGLAVGNFIFVFLMHSCLESAAQQWIDGIRTKALKHLLDQPRSWFDDDSNSADKIEACLHKSAEEMRSLLCSLAASALISICMMSTAILWSMILCWRLALAGLLMAPLLFFLSQVLERYSRTWEAKVHEAGLAAAEVLSEVCCNIRTVRAFHLESIFRCKHFRASQELLHAGRTRACVVGSFVGAMDASMIFSQAFIFWYGSFLIGEKDIAVSTIISVFSILLFSISSAGVMISSIPEVSSGQVAASRLLALSRLSKPDYLRKVHLIEASEFPHPIQFSGFQLQYHTRPYTYALSQLNMRIARGEAVGLIGASGSGKTTVLAALLGLYTGQNDRTLLLGTDSFSAYSLPTLRALIGYVPQNVPLLSDTVENNILYGINPWTMSSRHMSPGEAASLAGVDIFIQSLPDAYQTRIGSGGIGISLGQAQRIGIARALVRRPQLLLMDEPTSNLDAAAAAHVRTSIQNFVRQGTTVLVATHSTRMMMALDRLVVLDAGQVVEEGSWKDLIGQERSHLRHLLGCHAMIE